MRIYSLVATQSGSAGEESVAGDVEFPVFADRQQKGKTPLGLTLTLLADKPNFENTHFPNTFLTVLCRLYDH
jgi:hypothetical protein